MMVNDPATISAWEFMGQPKVVVKAPNLEEINKIQEVTLFFAIKMPFYTSYF